MIYFASDFHLGIPDRTGSLVREKMLVSWLESVRKDATAIFLMGDLFDFWFEYRTVVPKGYTRLFGKLSELVDAGIEIHLFRGNHDLWAFEYLEQEIGVKLHRKGELTMLGEKKFFLSHGDGLGPGDYGYKFLKRVFENRFNQLMYQWIHPDLGTKLGSYFSSRSRLTKMLREGPEMYASNDKAREPIIEFSRQLIASDPDLDFCLYGHVHSPEIIRITDKASVVFLGDWVSTFSYAWFDGNKLEIRKIH